MWTHFPQTIDDLLGDSLIQAVMRADRVEPRALKVMLTGVGAKVAARQEPKLRARRGARPLCGRDRAAQAGDVASAAARQGQARVLLLPLKRGI